MQFEFMLALPAQEADLDRILLAAFTPYVQKIGYETSGPYPWLAGAIAAGQIFVAMYDEDIAGLICVTRAGSEMAIDELGVDPAYQGQGVGRFLIAQTEERARASGTHRMTLFTVLIMADLVRFYEGQGYRESHRALPTHGEDTFMRVHFVKDL